MKNITQISNISGSVQIGEKNFAGSNITINAQGMFIDGVHINDVSCNQPQTRIVIKITGDVGSVESERGEILINGSVTGNVHSKSGTIGCGDVGGDIESKSGTVSCGNVKGNVESQSGIINCGSVGGSAKTLSGIITHG